jgi:homoserine O-acetyltransferase/O-succinyltransferase
LLIRQACEASQIAAFHKEVECASVAQPIDIPSRFSNSFAPFLEGEPATMAAKADHKPSGKSASIREIADPSSKVMKFGASAPLKLDAGVDLSPFQIAYQTYGTPNADKSNAILVCHALTGDQHVANIHPVTGKPGWWENMIGPGRIIDTDRYFVICANVIGGCMGSTGPASLNENIGKAWALDLPIITIADMVRAQAMLVEALGIEKLFLVMGGSMGGMQVLQWAAAYPNKVFAALPIATGARHSSQNIAFHEVGRQAVMADPDWREGRYLEAGVIPAKGLAVARMAAHITYLSDSALHRKFGRNLQDREALTFGFDADFQIESYLRHQGSSFVDRFDANAYLYMTRAMDYFDIAAEHGGVLANAFKGTQTRFCVMSFTSDWLFPTSESRAVVHALNAAGASVSFVEIETDKGHDAFLLDEPEMVAAVRGFVGAAARARGIA